MRVPRRPVRGDGRAIDARLIPPPLPPSLLSGYDSPMLSVVIALALAGVVDGRVPKGASIGRAEAVSFNVGHKSWSSKWCVKVLGAAGRRCENAQAPAVLSDEQRERLLTLLASKRTFIAADASCWNPHHAFVLYDNEDVPITQVNVCFECRQVSQRGVMSDAGRKGFLALFEEALKRPANSNGTAKEAPDAGDPIPVVD
jgi:hypothetical protein